MPLHIANDQTLTRIIPPPLPPNGGGFWYLQRLSDRAILLDDDGDYVQFDDEAEARYAAADHGPGVIAKWMPKLRTN